MSVDRLLIVNADDFGAWSGVNEAIIAAHEDGVVTTTSLMVYGEAASAAADYARRRTALGVGLHLDLGEWAYRDGEWKPLYERVSLGDANAVRGEIERQLRRFIDLVGAEPTHLDSHQHVHLNEPVRSAVVELAARLGTPVRSLGRIHYCGRFYGQNSQGEPYPEGISVERLISLIDGLPPGVSELACHPGLRVEPPTMYRAERETELATLRHPAVRDAVERAGVRLVRFDSLDR